MWSGIPILTASAIVLVTVLMPVSDGIESYTGDAATNAEAAFPSADTLRDAALTGTPVALAWQGASFFVVLEVNERVHPATYSVTDVDGAAVDVSYVTALQGHVVGDASSVVRMTLAGDAIDGMILGRDVGHIGVSTTDGEVTLSSPAAGPGPEVPLRKIDDEPAPLATVGGGCGVPLNVMGSPFGLVSGWPERTVEIAFSVDDEYAAKLEGGDWAAATIALANRLDGFYDHENDIRFSVVHMIRVPQSIFQEETTSQALDDIAAYYDEHYPEFYREVAFLMSGVDFTNALGQTSCIGGIGYGRDHYVTGFMLFEQEWGINIGPFKIYGDSALKVIAHEVGHQFGVRHEQHDCVEVFESYTTSRPIDVCTTMAPYVDLHGVGFSTWSRLTSRGTADYLQL